MPLCHKAEGALPRWPDRAWPVPREAERACTGAGRRGPNAALGLRVPFGQRGYDEVVALQELWPRGAEGTTPYLLETGDGVPEVQQERGLSKGTLHQDPCQEDTTGRALSGRGWGHRRKGRTCGRGGAPDQVLHGAVIRRVARGLCYPEARNSGRGQRTAKKTPPGEPSLEEGGVTGEQ
ncbi:hypothetical protein NDU88_006164 [Pleurodeles waltl]|uniref:Uncharacterized protein n=1 Tax=Pleurodeles waltl TaxID=8319 RepID=A0AAV7NSH0_PLEWA|nr:hypothetical protein NDU88_006164 [Pleurodeles waltl]